MRDKSVPIYITNSILPYRSSSLPDRKSTLDLTDLNRALTRDPFSAILGHFPRNTSDLTINSGWIFGRLWWYFQGNALGANFMVLSVIRAMLMALVVSTLHCQGKHVLKVCTEYTIFE